MFPRCALGPITAFPAIKAIYSAWAELDIAPTFSNRLLLAGVRFCIAGAALLVISRHPWRQLAATPKGPLLAFACTQTFVQYIFFYTGLAVSSAVLGSLLIASGSFWWLLLAPVMLGTPWPRRAQWLLLGMGAVNQAQGRRQGSRLTFKPVSEVNDKTFGSTALYTISRGKLAFQ